MKAILVLLMAIICGTFAFAEDGLRQTSSFTATGTACGSPWTDDVNGMAVAFMDGSAANDCTKIGSSHALRISSVVSVMKLSNAGKLRCDTVTADYECQDSPTAGIERAKFLSMRSIDDQPLDPSSVGDTPGDADCIRQCGRKCLQRPVFCGQW